MLQLARCVGIIPKPLQGTGNHVGKVMQRCEV